MAAVIVGITSASSGEHTSASVAQTPSAPAPAQPGATRTAVQTQTVIRTITAPAAGPPKPYQTYRDSQFGFSVQVPGSYLQQASSSPAGVTYQSPDGQVVISVFEQARGTGLDPTAAEAVAEASFRSRGGQSTYTFHDDQSYIVSGYTSDGSVYYEFGYLGASEQAGFRWIYPVSAKAATDRLVTHAYESFRPGSL